VCAQKNQFQTLGIVQITPQQILIKGGKEQRKIAPSENTSFLLSIQGNLKHFEAIPQF
jgi:hypothetical protein